MGESEMKEKIVIDHYTYHNYGDLSQQYIYLKDFFNKNLEKFELVFGRKIQMILIRGKRSGTINIAHTYRVTFNFERLPLLDSQFWLEGEFSDELIKDRDALFLYLKSRIQKTTNET